MITVTQANKCNSKTSYSYFKDNSLYFITTIGPLIAALCNRFGCRLVCIAGALLYSMGFIISAFATNFALLYISLGIFTGS